MGRRTAEENKKLRRKVASLEDSLLLLDEFHKKKLDKVLEEQRQWFDEQLIDLRKETLLEISKHCITRNNLENEQSTRLDIEFALDKERQEHKKTKRLMYLETKDLKRKVEMYEGHILLKFIPVFRGE